MSLFRVKIRRLIRSLTNRKHYLEFLVVILTVPVLLTVLITNILNLQNKPKITQVKDTRPIIIETSKDNSSVTPQMVVEKIVQVTPATNCKKVVGPISISFPEESQQVSDNPVCIIIKYDDPNYCSVVWSYRINGVNWSDYTSNSVCLYNVPKGNMKFELRAQSTVSQDTQSLTRNFIYTGNSTEFIPTSTPSASSN